MTRFDKKLAKLLADYGYSYSFCNGKVKIGCYGVMDDSYHIVPISFNGFFNACDYLIPIIGPEFQREFERACKS